MVFCRNCGAQMEDDSMYCPRCQTPVTANAVAGAPVPDMGMADPKPKKSVFKKWWFWLIIALVAVFAVALVKVISVQTAFKEYYNEDVQDFKREIMVVEQMIGDTLDMSYTGAKEYWEAKDVESKAKELVDEVSGYKPQSDEVKEVHVHLVDACEYLQEATEVIGDALEDGDLDTGKIEECSEKYEEALEEFNDKCEDICEEYGMKIIRDDEDEE